MSNVSNDTLRELQELCCEPDGIPEEERVARLEALLIDRPDVQDEYCRLMSLNMLLQTEFNVDGVSFSSLLPEDSRPASVVLRTPTLELERESNQRMWQFVAIAATLAAALSFIVPRVGGPTISSDPDLSGEEIAEANFEGLLPSLETIGMLHRVTRNSWERPQAPVTNSGSDLTLNLVEGAVTMPDFNGKASRGFVLKLPPGGVLQLTTYAEAAGKNALAIIELDKHGEPTGQLVSFGNQNLQNERSNVPIYGQLGSWSEVNDTQTDKFYLLTGLQKVDLPGEEVTWYVADYSVFLNERDLLYIGWDDTGWSNQGELHGRRDSDYNDLSVIVHLSTPGTTPSETKPSMILPEPVLDEIDAEFTLTPESIDRGYRFEVQPGERVIVNANGDPRYRNSLAFVNSRTGSVLWHKQNERGRYSLLGVFLIDNSSEEPMYVSMIGQHEGLEQQERSLLAHELLLEDDYRQVVGFDASAQDQDWADLRVRFFWLDGRSLGSEIQNDSM